MCSEIVQPQSGYGIGDFGLVPVHAASAGKMGMRELTYPDWALINWTNINTLFIKGRCMGFVP